MTQPAGAVGLFVGYQEITGLDGAVVYRLFGAEFSDYWSADEADPVVLAQIPDIRDKHGLTTFDYLFHRSRPGDMNRARATGLISFPFVPACQPPGVWRGVALEVSPNGVMAYWRNRPEDKWVSAGAVGLVELRKSTEGHQAEVLTAIPAAGIALGGWNPRRPLGLYAWNSTVSFKNVVLRPLPSTPRSP
jgi:hypothetical protein